MRPLLRALLAAGLGICAAVLVSCGQSNGLLSASEASPLNSSLDAISTAVAARDCPKAELLATRLGSSVGKLPLTVDRQLRLALGNGAQTVAERARRACMRTTKTTTTTSTVPTTVQTTQTTTTTTTTTPSTATSTPTDTTSTSTTPTSTATTPTTTTPTGTTAPGGAGPGGAGATTP